MCIFCFCFFHLSDFYFHVCVMLKTLVMGAPYIAHSYQYFFRENELFVVVMIC